MIALCVECESTFETQTGKPVRSAGFLAEFQSMFKRRPRLPIGLCPACRELLDIEAGVGPSVERAEELVRA